MKNLAIILSSCSKCLMKSYVNKKIVPNFDILDQPIIQYINETLSNEFKIYYLLKEMDKENYLIKNEEALLFLKENAQIVDPLFSKKDILKTMDNVLFIYDNMPLITQESIQKLLSNINNYDVVYNEGICLIKANVLCLFLEKLQIKDIYDLNELIKSLKTDGKNVKKIDLNENDLFEVVDRLTLSNAQQIMKKRINEFHMLNGISIVDPLNTYIGKHVKIGNDTTIYPNTYIFGLSIIGTNCEIGPNALIENSFIDNDVTISNGIVKHQTIKNS